MYTVQGRVAKFAIFIHERKWEISANFNSPTCKYYKARFTFTCTFFLNITVCILQVQNTCEKCGTLFGKYFCDICNFFDDNIEKEQFHCDGCGLCR